MKALSCIFLVACLVGRTGTACAQQAAHTLGLGYGYGTREQLLNGFLSGYKSYSADEQGFLNQGIASDITGAGQRPVHYGDRQRSGVFLLSYQYRFRSWLSAGLDIGYEQEQASLTVTTAPYEETRIGSYRRGATTIAPEVLLTYKRSSLVQVYGSLGMGITFISERVSGDKGARTLTGNYFAFQATPFGLRIGRRVAGYLELGYGYKGFGHIGLACSF